MVGRRHSTFGGVLVVLGFVVHAIARGHRRFDFVGRGRFLAVHANWSAGPNCRPVAFGLILPHAERGEPLDRTSQVTASIGANHGFVAVAASRASGLFFYFSLVVLPRLLAVQRPPRGTGPKLTRMAIPGN